MTDTYPEEITSLLPHRDPILLVDHLLQVGNRMVAEKEIRPDELLCYGEPIYPLALLLESAAQGAIAGFIAGARDGRPAPNQGFLFMGLQSVDLLDRVPLGAVLRHELTGVRDLGDVLVLDLISWVEGAPVLVATGVTAAVRPFAEFRRSDHE
ncbi:3-hydroxyacyl-ACP dehydratase FabZ family protein [Propionibacterium sp. oral taxon 192]|uniref:3-hydroxyacyl-ACP dehydratase FabZ family protein n=1 Tax=Propionibacterium sp. oral taxon 192 TaxID=671222 RepID=UPI0003A67DDF|nr:hypothetical protein [Propionibacterium sp. oral taxon 192]